MDNWPLAQLAALYGIKINHVQPKNKILCLESSLGPLALKKSSLCSDELLLQCAILQHLDSVGYRQVARIIPTLDKQFYAQLGNDIFSLTTWIAGRHPNFNSSTDLAFGAKTLASFHLKARDYHGPTHWQKSRIYGVWPMRFNYRLSYLEWYRRCICARGIQDEFDQLFMELVGYFLDQGYHVVKSLRNPSYYRLSVEAQKQGTICHHDFAYHNILIDPNNRPWVIDFDYCLLDLQVHDLGNFISRHVKYTKWSFSDVYSILLEYHETKPLSYPELEALLLLMEFPQDFWQIAWAKYNEVNMHKTETLLQRLKKAEKTEMLKQQCLNELSHLIRGKNLLPGRETL